MSQVSSRSEWGVGRLLAATLVGLSFCGTPLAADFPRDVLKGIEAMRRLPVDGFHVVQSQGRLLLVSTNGHYVISDPRILDLWNEIEIKSVADVDATLKVPLARMGIDATAFGGTVLGRTDFTRKLTVFMDPASASTKRLLNVLRTLSETYRVELVFIPAKSERAGVSRALICNKQSVAAFIQKGELPAPLRANEPCGEKELERARVTAKLIGIETLPFTISGNGATIAGSPAEYAQFIAANQVSP